MGPGSALVFGSGAVGAASGTAVGFYFGASAAAGEAGALATSSGGIVYAFMGGSEALAATTMAGAVAGTGIGIVVGGIGAALYYLSQLPADRPSANPVYIFPY